MALTLSVIVPVYNVERYLEKCLKSILSQGLSQDCYEIILVDDGSTDNGRNICDIYASNESNISVIHQMNQGLSVARNVGLSKARGEFVLFVDSDDFLQQGVFEILVSTMKESKLDVLRFKYMRVLEGEQPLMEPSQTPKASIISDVYVGHNYLVHRLGNECYAWQFIIRKDFLSQNGLYFKPGIIFEDTEWTPRILEKAQRVSEIDLLVYYYLIREGSITQSSSERVVCGQMNLIDILKGQGSHLEAREWHNGMIAHMVVSIITTLGTNLYNQRELYLSELKRKNVYPLSYYNASKRSRRKISIINLSPKLACMIIHLTNK